MTWLIPPGTNAAFSVPAPGDYGPYDRFYVRNPGINNHDLSIFKNFPFGSRGRRMVQLRVEMFNIFNHKNFGSYTTVETNASYGLPTSNTGLAYQPRMMQLGFRIAF